MSKKEELQPEIYALCEAVADIAHTAGLCKFYSGDSREDIALFIEWAQEFERLNEGIGWGKDRDYIDEIDKFAADKLKEHSHLNKNLKP